MNRNPGNMEFQAVFPVEPSIWADCPEHVPGFALGLRCDEARPVPAVTNLVFLPHQEGRPPQSEFAQKVVDALTEWLQDPRYLFGLPVAPEGTEFQKQVWSRISVIPYGQTINYARIARRINSSPRAVGGACAANPIPILIPCHRVIAHNGALSGFNHATTGWLPEVKRWLLAREGVEILGASRV